MIICPRLNEIIKDLSSDLNIIVKDVAPETINHINNGDNSLIVWSGASDKTIFGDPAINYMFRAIHDRMHIETGLTFTVEDELRLGELTRQRFAKYGQTIADLVYIEVAGQIEYIKQFGVFPDDQLQFTLNQLKNIA